MFLPFLPLILASAGLTLFSRRAGTNRTMVEFTTCRESVSHYSFQFSSGANASMALAI